MAEELNTEGSGPVLDYQGAAEIFGVDAALRYAEDDGRLLLWLHAEAAWWLQLDRDEHESAEVLHMWSKRVAYLECRVAQLHAEKAREGSEEGSGRDDTGQAGREEAAEQTVGTGYPQGSGPGHGSATPAPLSSRPQCAVHPDGETA